MVLQLSMVVKNDKLMMHFQLTVCVCFLSQNPWGKKKHMNVLTPAFFVIFSVGLRCFNCLHVFALLILLFL